MGSRAGAQSRRRQLRAAGVLAVGILLACIAALLSPPFAHAAAVFSAATPTPDTTAAGSPALVSVIADDTSAINSASLMLNGVTSAMTVNWPGHWEGPDCEEYWVVDDWTAATLTFSTTPLPQGSYDATVTIQTASSGPSTYHWRFVVAWPPGSQATFLNRVPAPDSTMTVAAPITMRVQSINPISIWSYRLYLDGVNQWVGSTGSGLGYINVSTVSAIAMSDGPHSLKATIVDSLNIYTEESWTFNVAVPPTLSSPTPVGAATMTNMRPPVGLTITDNSPGQMHVRMVFDGVEVFDGQAAQGAFSWTPPSDLAQNSTHTVLVEATDVAGNTSSTSWQFSDIEMFSSQTPTPDTTLTGSPTYVSVYVDEGSTILTTSKIFIDGAPATTSIDWLGHWEDPDCQEIWVVDDYTQATISAPTGVLLEGVHTVRVELNTQSSGSSVHEWSFVIKYPPGSAATITNKLPAPGSTVTGSTNMTFRVESINDIWYGNIAVYVNGTRVFGTVSPYTGKVENVTVGPAAFTSTDGLQAIRVTVLDSTGVYTEHAWTFNTQIKPTATEPYPANATTVGQPRQQVGLRVGDNAAGQLRLRMTVDGAVVQDGLVNQGYFRWTPGVDYANNSSHPVTAQVWDAAGNTVSTSWTFSVVAQPPMSDANNCTACHTTYPGAHPFGTCDGCHRDDPLYDPHGPNRYAPLGPCVDCHGYGGGHWPGVVADCAYCHTSTAWTQIPRHDSARVEVVHTPPANECDDSGCHVGSLVTVHTGVPQDSPFKMQCASCHTSTDPDVIAAIVANNTSCTACHKETDPHHATADVSALANGDHQCSVCHSASITAEHLKSTSSSAADQCDACHAPGGARDQVTGAWDQTCDTTGCHSAGSTRAVHDNYCLACHDTTQPDFSTSKTGFPAVDDVNRNTACKACHTPGLVGTHPYHQIGSNCGSACHPGWGTSLSSATPGYTDPVSLASFADIGSKATPAALLHTIHATPRWPAGVNTVKSACSSCHATAACGACHTGALPATHGEHSSTDQTGNAAWTGLVSYGVVGGDQTQRTAYVDTVQCASPGCHDIASSASSVARSIEDYNYVVGGNPDDPTGTSSAISTVGTWRWRASNRYSGGRMSYANLAGTSLTAQFTGERIEIVSDRDPYRGQADVLLDGAVVGSFDAYAPTTRYQAVVFSMDVTPGPHTITVRPTGIKSGSARGAFVVADAFRVYEHIPQLYVPACADCHADRSTDHW